MLFIPICILFPLVNHSHLIIPIFNIYFIAYFYGLGELAPDVI